MNPDLAAAFDRIDSLLDVDPAHKDRTDLLAWLNENGWTDATGDFHVNAAALAARLAATEPSRDPSGVKHDPTECADCARIKGVVIAPHDLACGRSPGQPDPLCAACATTDAATPDHTEGGDR